MKKSLGLTLAAVMVLSGGSVVLAQAQGPTVASSIEIAVAEQTKVEKEELKFEIPNLLKVDGKIPAIKGLRNEELERKINESIKSQVGLQVIELTQQAQELAKEAKKEGWEMRPYELIVDYDVKSTGDILSFEVVVYPVTGGTGMPITSYYNINTKKASVIELKDLFKNGANYTGIINKEIKAQIKEANKKQPNTYFTDEGGFETISKDQKFFIKDGQIVIAFDKYEIGPGATGTPHFTISKDLLKSIMK